MSKIKTALEIALEKSAGLKADPAEMRKMELKKKAGRLANQLMEKPETDLKKEFLSFNNDEKVNILMETQKIILNYLNLSAYYNDFQTGQALNALKKIKAKPGKIDSLANDIKHVLQSYSEQLKQIYENLKEQFSSRMNEMKEQMGAEFDDSMDPEEHPHFIQYWNQTKEQLDTQLGSHLEQLKNAISKTKNLYS